MSKTKLFEFESHWDAEKRAIVITVTATEAFREHMMQMARHVSAHAIVAMGVQDQMRREEFAVPQTGEPEERRAHLGTGTDCTLCGVEIKPGQACVNDPGRGVRHVVGSPLCVVPLGVASPETHEVGSLIKRSDRRFWVGPDRVVVFSSDPRKPEGYQFENPWVEIHIGDVFGTRGEEGNDVGTWECVGRGKFHGRSPYIDAQRLED